MMHAPDFSALMCSSPDSGVEFHKHSLQPNSTKSSVSSEQSEQSAGSEAPESISMCPANLNSPFLLSLHLYDPRREKLVHKLTSDTTELGGWFSVDETTAAAQPTERVALHCPEFSQREGPLCCICRQPVTNTTQQNPEHSRFRYSLKKMTPKVSISLNGEDIMHSASLRHGDIISIASAYSFMFKDYISFSAAGSVPQYHWKVSPHPSAQEAPEEDSRKMSTSVETITDCQSPRTGATFCDLEAQGDRAQHTNSVQVVPESSAQTSDLQEEQVSCQTVPLKDSKALHSSSSSSSKPSTKSEEETGSNPPRTARHKKVEKARSHNALGKTRSLPLPNNRKLVFSFKASEEDTLLGCVVSTETPKNCSLSKLAPAYILAMCTEYCMMNSGLRAVLRFIQKATDQIQEVVWVRLSLE